MRAHTRFALRAGTFAALVVLASPLALGTAPEAPRQHQPSVDRAALFALAVRHTALCNRGHDQSCKFLLTLMIEESN